MTATIKMVNDDFKTAKKSFFCSNFVLAYRQQLREKCQPAHIANVNNKLWKKTSCFWKSVFVLVLSMASHFWSTSEQHSNLHATNGWHSYKRSGNGLNFFFSYTVIFMKNVLSTIHICFISFSFSFVFFSSTCCYCCCRHHYTYIHILCIILQKIIFFSLLHSWIHVHI